MVDLVYSDGLKALQQRMGTLFNNVNYSDTVFTVKNQKFYALSQLVAVASVKLDSVISEHFAHCDDRKITLYEVKCQESFSIVLQYMYGLDINFSQMKMSVLCEVINLAENYQLATFSEDLKNYLSKIDTFEIDSLTVVLNTARKYNLNELYERLKVFAFEHAAAFVKHESIIKLQYEVLLNLIKSDWFCAPEIDILMGVLNWHNEMTTKSPKDTVEKDCGSDNDVGNQDVDMEADHSYAASGDEENVQEQNQDIEPEKEEEDDDIRDKEQGGINQLNELVTRSELSSTNKRNDCAELVKSFTHNVLKSLLVHVRVKQITMYEHMQLRQTSLFDKYKHMFDDFKHFSQASKLRQKYGTVVNEVGNGMDDLLQSNEPSFSNEPSSSNEPFSSTEHAVTQVGIEDPFNINIPDNKVLKLHNIKRKFRVEKNFLFARDRYEMDILTINNNFVWNIWLQNDTSDIGALVQCTKCTCTNCTSFTKWECKAECELTLIAPFKNHSSKVIPEKLVLFDNGQYCTSQSLGRIYWRDCKGWYDAFKSGDFMEFEINFKSITIKKN